MFGSFGDIWSFSCAQYCDVFVFERSLSRRPERDGEISPPLMAAVREPRRLDERTKQTLVKLWHAHRNLLCTTTNRPKRGHDPGESNFPNRKRRIRAVRNPKLESLQVHKSKWSKSRHISDQISKFYKTQR